MNIFAEALSEVADQVRQSTVKVRGAGSGVVWRSDGLIVTNAHVATRERMQVELADGRVLPAVLEKRDPGRDLASLRVGARDLTAASTVACSQLRPGAMVVAIGNPLGFTTGIVHSVGSSWIQADITLAPGNSGGPLADVRGRVAGINSMVAGGIGFAVPSDSVERFLRGEEEHPRIGVTLQGPVIVDVEAGGIAARAGLCQGDVLVACEGRAYRTPQDLLSVLRDSRKGRPVLLHLLRGNREVAAEVLVRP